MSYNNTHIINAHTVQAIRANQTNTGEAHWIHILKTKIMIFNEKTQVSRDVNMFTFEAKHIEQVDS